MRIFTPRAVIGVWDSSVVTGSGDRYQSEIRNASGTIVSRIVVNTSRVAVTREMRDARINLTMLHYQNRQGEGGLKPNLEELAKIERDTPVADSLASYAQFLTTPNKTMWVVDVVPPGATEWNATAFRTDGAILGRLHARGGGRPVAFGNDRVVVRTEDADGVVTFSVRRIGITTAKPK